MQFSVRDVASILKVPEGTVYRWVNEDNLPATETNGQYRFNRAELLEWATVRRLDISPEIFAGTPVGSGAHLELTDALEAGGIVYGLGGRDKPSVLREVVAALPLPDEFDRESLLELFLAREATGSTGVGDGIAIPHPRHPVVLPVGRPCLSLDFLAHPVDFGAADQEAVHTLFVLISPTTRVHLQMLARIACLLRDEGFRDLLKRRRSREEILAETRRIESAFDRTPAVRAGHAR